MIRRYEAALPSSTGILLTTPLEGKDGLNLTHATASTVPRGRALRALHITEPFMLRMNLRPRL